MITGTGQKSSLNVTFDLLLTHALQLLYMENICGKLY
ncbi:hypothetical protein DPMN_169917 [Dreissena polymorpha]|uniref:Uncharacterized protein n=1 Tax=Dreissena polymorpha TaxID=45954 RepID=A0A9D4DXM9_DREPO|nr:hypothetical protein DPMN_169917 [Dreissena polymorpha]